VPLRRVGFASRIAGLLIEETTPEVSCDADACNSPAESRLMEWSGRAPPLPASNAGMGRREEHCHLWRGVAPYRSVETAAQLLGVQAKLIMVSDVDALRAAGLARARGQGKLFGRQGWAPLLRTPCGLP
jgi:hypothetical protein